MSRQRFCNLLRFLRFDDHSTRLDRLKSDKLAPIRHIFESIKTSLFDSYYTGTYLTIDERLCKYWDKCTFRQYYMPRKPDKFGLKLWIFADSLTCHPVGIEVYVGKQQLLISN